MPITSTLTITNPTKHFNPTHDRSKVSIANPNLWQTAQQKREGYETRLYYEWLRTDKLGGQTFFYTLTYNNKSIPQYMGFPCFDYEDLRDLFVGGFQKKLYRDYGSALRYFVGSELGEGAGKRGKGNNPHYHILFFLTPAPHDETRSDGTVVHYDYKKIKPEEFRSLVRLYWQGAEVIKFQKAKYGRAQEGSLNMGLVTSHKAITYCAKYCVKDSVMKSREEAIGQKAFSFRYSQLSRGHVISCDSDSADYDNVVKAKKFADTAVKYFRKRHSQKVRISNGVGEYMLETITDKMDPRVNYPSKDGFKKRQIPLYAFRKLFTTNVRRHDGTYLRYLNEDGKRYRVSQLDKTLSKVSLKAKNALSAVLSNPHHYYTFYGGFRLPEDTLRESLTNKQLFDDYALYKLIYEHRSFAVARRVNTVFDNSFTYSYYPPINPKADYYYSLTRGVELYVRAGEDYSEDETLLSYSVHPRFAKNIDLFAVLDSAVSFMAVCKDFEDEKKDRERTEIRKRLVRSQLTWLDE